MKIIAIIPHRYWLHASGRRASLYGAVPYYSEAEKAEWQLIEKGFTTENDNGTIGVARPPFETREQGERFAKLFNTCDWDAIRAEFPRP